MRVKCGVDIIEISRIQDSIEKLGDAFLNKVYTKKEIEYCESKGKNKYQHYAARFAVKEATFKAIWNILDAKNSITWKNVETINDTNGKPHIKFVNVDEKILQKIESIDVSISHIEKLAVANVTILVKD